MYYFVMRKLITRKMFSFTLSCASTGWSLASFPGLVRLSLAVRNSRRRPGLVRHVISATAYVTTILLKINDLIRWVV